MGRTAPPPLPLFKRSGCRQRAEIRYAFVEIIKARRVEADHVELAVHNCGAGLTLASQLVLVRELIGERDAIMREEALLCGRYDAEEPAAIE